MVTGAPALEGELILYFRPGCHLCAEAEALLQPLLAGAGREARRIDVDSDAGALARYGDRVPVLTAGGRELCWGRFQPALLAAMFGQRLSTGRGPGLFGRLRPPRP